MKKVLGEEYPSPRFMELMKTNIRHDFKRNTGIDLDKCSRRISFSPIGFKFFIVENVGIIDTEIVVYEHAYPVKINWKSKIDGMQILPDNDEFNLEDVVMWFDEIPAKSIVNKYYKKPMSRELDNLGLKAKLRIDYFFNESLYLIISSPEAKEISRSLEEKVQEFNMDNSNGKIHNHRIVEEGKNKIKIYMDLGSAPSHFLRKLLKSVDEENRIDEILITSFL